MPKKKKIILFFDEFPWMATPRSKLITTLELYWNRYWVFDDRIKLIICGSTTSWIIENIINNKGGLHNRVTCSIQLKPFLLHETEKFLKENQMYFNRPQILDLYIIFGGVPLYWSFIRKAQAVHQCIDELCFQRDGPLLKEFGRLFESLLKMRSLVWILLGLLLSIAMDLVKPNSLLSLNFLTGEVQFISCIS